MADDTAGNIAAVSQQGNIQGLVALMNALYPAGGYTSSQTTGPQTVTTSDKTQTTEEIASPEAVKQLIQQMLQGNSGLAAVAQGEKGAGLYNTTTNQQLMNDLMSRVAAAGAALNKKTVQTISGGTTTTSGQTTTANKTMTPQLTAGDLAKLVGGGAGAAALAKAAQDLLKPGPQGNGGSKGDSGKRKKQDVEEPPGDRPDLTMRDANNPVYDTNFIQAIDPSMRNNPGDQVQFAAQGDSMLMTPVNDPNALMNQSLNMGGLLNENNAVSTDQYPNQVTDPVTGLIDLGGAVFGDQSGNSGGFFDNVSNAVDTPTDSIPDPVNTPSHNSYNSWDEYMNSGQDREPGARFSEQGQEYIMSPNGEMLNFDQSFMDSLDSNGQFDFSSPNFDWGSFDWGNDYTGDYGYDGAYDTYVT
jgi:hypothetical protein